MLRCSQYTDLVYSIIGASMRVHTELGSGLLEPIYQESLGIELKFRGIDFEREKDIDCYYRGNLLEKKYRMDLIVRDIIIEVKSVSHILPVHRAQLCNYLRLTKKPLGLLVNFGEASLIGERWAYDEEENACLIVDKNMEPVFDADYELLLSGNLVD